MTCCGAVDIHTHIVPASLPDYAGSLRDIAWPSVEHNGDCHARVLTGGKPYRDIDHRCWNTALRVEQMERMGVERQVLSPMPELLSYWFPAKDAQLLARSVNEQVAAMVAEAPSRFAGLGMVPLQSPDLAIEELLYLKSELGLAGVEIGTNVNGTPIGHSDFDEFFAAAEAQEVSIFVHPLHPTGMEKLVGPPVLEQVVAFPCETALAAASLLTGGIVERYPRLRIALSHGGGAFGQVLPRLQHAWSLAPGLQRAMKSSPAELARMLFYDTLVYDPLTLRFLIDRFGVDQVIVGTDYPFAIMEAEPIRRLQEIGLSETDREKIQNSNALRFLGESSGAQAAATA